MRRSRSPVARRCPRLALPLGSAGARAGGAEREEATPHYPLLHPQHVDWSFGGPFGKYDPQQLQRGFQVYREVCSSCHSLSWWRSATSPTRAGRISARSR